MKFIYFQEKINNAQAASAIAFVEGESYIAHTEYGVSDTVRCYREESSLRVFGDHPKSMGTVEEGIKAYKNMLTNLLKEELETLKTAYGIEPKKIAYQVWGTSDSSGVYYDGQVDNFIKEHDKYRSEGNTLASLKIYGDHPDSMGTVAEGLLLLRWRRD